jgi:hypothetical protein
LAAELCAGEIIPKSEVTFSDAKILLAYARESLRAAAEKRSPSNAALTDPRLLNAANGIHLALLAEGRLKAQSLARQATLPGNIRLAAERISQNQTEDLKNCVVVLTIFCEEDLFPGAPLPSVLEKKAELGLDGLQADYFGKVCFLSPIKLYFENWGWQETLLALAEGVAPESLPKITGRERDAQLLREVIIKPEFKLHLFRAATFLSFAVDENPVPAEKFEAPYPLSSVAAGSIQGALSLAQKWYLENQSPDGTFPEEIIPGGETTLQKIDPVKQLRNLAALGALWRETGNDALRQAGLKGLRHLLQLYYKEDEKLGYLLTENQPDPSASAAALRALVSLKADEDQTLAKQAQSLAGYLNSLRRVSGEYVAEKAEKGFPLLAQLALAQWGKTNNDQLTLAGCALSSRFYLKYFARNPQDISVLDFMQAYALLHEPGLSPADDSQVVKTGLMLAATQEKRPDIDGRPSVSDLGRFAYPPDGNGFTSLCLNAEIVGAVCGACRVAEKNGDSVSLNHLREAARWGARFLLQKQIFDRVDLAVTPFPEKALGAFRPSGVQKGLKLEDMAQAVEALLLAQKVLP